MVVNTTFHVESSVEKAFVEWIQTTYLPEAKEKGRLHSPLFMRILVPMEGGVGYAVQHQAASRASVEEWLESFQPGLLSDMSARWGRKVMFFSTIMEEVKE